MDDKYKKTDGVFVCRKCGHFLYVGLANRSAEDFVKALEKTDCPDCGEISIGNWVFERLGNFNNEVLR